MGWNTLFWAHLFGLVGRVGLVVFGWVCGKHTLVPLCGEAPGGFDSFLVALGSAPIPMVHLFLLLLGGFIIHCHFRVFT